MPMNMTSVGYEVLTELARNVAILWDITPFSPMGIGFSDE
jgi:hypothetical protein